MFMSCKKTGFRQFIDVAALDKGTSIACSLRLGNAPALP
jgi:hypothetical protein